jgi:hypothetical protein
MKRSQFVFVFSNVLVLEADSRFGGRVRSQVCTLYYIINPYYRLITPAFETNILSYGFF